MKNHITLYSSGIGVLVRQADIAKGAVTPFRIPIKKSHRMDVIASLRVFGNGIKLQDSIGWPQDEKTQLTIDPTKVQESLLTQLSGRNIKFKPKQGQEATGINLGLQTQTEMLSDHRTVERPYVVIHVDKGGINRYALDQIDSLEFTEPEVNAEIVKAYQNNAAKLREDITFVTFSVIPKDANAGATAYYQYAFPNPPGSRPTG